MLARDPHAGRERLRFLLFVDPADPRVRVRPRGGPLPSTRARADLGASASAPSRARVPASGVRAEFGACACVGDTTSSASAADARDAADAPDLRVPVDLPRDRARDLDLDRAWRCPYPLLCPRTRRGAAVPLPLALAAFVPPPPLEAPPRVRPRPPGRPRTTAPKPPPRRPRPGRTGMPPVLTAGGTGLRGEGLDWRLPLPDLSLRWGCEGRDADLDDDARELWDGGRGIG